MKKILYISIFTLLFITVACEQNLVSEDISTHKISITENWTVNAYLDNNLVFGPFTVSTQMTSAENESIIIKDNGEFWKFQTKAQLSDSKNEFQAQSSVNLIGSIESKINILDGSIIDNDSIAFDIQFEDDETPFGFTYIIKGHREK